MAKLVVVVLYLVVGLILMVALIDAGQTNNTTDSDPPVDTNDVFFDIDDYITRMKSKVLNHEDEPPTPRNHTRISLLIITDSSLITNKFHGDVNNATKVIRDLFARTNQAFYDIDFEYEYEHLQNYGFTLHKIVHCHPAVNLNGTEWSLANVRDVLRSPAFRKEREQYGFVMLLTDRLLLNIDPKTQKVIRRVNGFASGKVCDREWNVGAVSFHPRCTPPQFTLTHELGHALGAIHDKHSGYLMAPDATWFTVTNLQMSSKTKHYIARFLFYQRYDDTTTCFVETQPADQVAVDSEHCIRVLANSSSVLKMVFAGLLIFAVVVAVGFYYYWRGAKRSNRIDDQMDLQKIPFYGKIDSFDPNEAASEQASE